MDRLGYVHRDITPWNIGQAEGRGCLFDMSIAKVSLWMDTYDHWYSWILEVLWPLYVALVKYLLKSFFTQRTL